ncbi:fizzy-related protein homolog [Zootermopsis nevadensis]|uniref:fizzy-related protein homolog n=1 Tax=Zootermopsis nevadensis TaxID=136037 RepID=UPI000B8E6E1C|nr:fizzy-related protein homolog [Zootermopsis nevadensis]
MSTVCQLNSQVNELLSHPDRVGSLAWNGDVVSSGSRDGLILQCDVRTPSVVPERRLVGHRQEIHTVSIFSSEDKDISSPHRITTQKNSINIFTTVCGLKWSPDKQSLASGGSDSRLSIWNLHSDSPVQTYTQHLAAVKAIAWSPQQRGLLASGGADRCIRFWNTLTGQPKQFVDTGSQVCNLIWSKHSSELVSTHDTLKNHIRIWRYPRMSQVASLTGHSSAVPYVAVSPDGEDIVTGAGDETLHFWKVFDRDRSQKEKKSSVLDLFQSIR